MKDTKCNEEIYLFSAFVFFVIFVVNES